MPPVGSGAATPPLGGGGMLWPPGVQDAQLQAGSQHRFANDSLSLEAGSDHTGAL